MYNYMSFQCISLANSALLRNQFPIVQNQKVAYLSLGVLSLLFAIFNIITIVKVKSLREPPIDILLILMVFSILKTMVIFSTIIYDSIYTPKQMPKDFQTFCLATGIISSIAQSIKIIYSIVMSLLYIKKVKNPLKAWITGSKQIHFVCLFIVLVITLSFVFTDNIGMSLYGFCSVQFSNKSLFVAPIIDLLFLLILVILSVIFLRRVQKLSASRKVISQFYNIYLLYIALFIINQLIITISQFIVLAQCQSQSNFKIFNSFRILANTSSFSISFFVFIIILRNSQLRRTFILALTEDLHKKFKQSIEYTQRRVQNQAAQRMSFYNELLTTNRNTIFIQLANMVDLQNGYLVNLKDKNRACLLSSLLGCLCIQYIQFKNHMIQINSSSLRTSSVEEDHQQFFAFNYNEKYSFVLNNQIVQYYQHVFTKKMPTLYLKFVTYSPAIMKTFSQMNHQIDFEQKLSPIFNEEAIIKDCKASAEGGRSGQFFFFNADNTLIIKTLNQSEKKTFLQRIQDFHEYFMRQQSSLIVKLYSIFTVINADTSDEIHFMLMGNLLRGLKQQYILRCYDLKGSLHHRQVMKNENIIQGQKIKNTMKDIDFLRFEHKIWIKEQDANTLRKTIIKDSMLFQSLGLIDYSLIVMKLDVKAILTSSSQSKILKELKVIMSNKEQGIGYLFGIIDYLETWNMRKKGQKWYKSLFTKSQKISSQDPYFYSQRFINFARQILANN